MASLGHPIIGDFKYGRRSALDKQLGRHQIGLHAQSIRFKPPNRNREQNIDVGLSKTMQELVDRLGL